MRSSSWTSASNNFIYSISVHIAYSYINLALKIFMIGKKISFYVSVNVKNFNIRITIRTWSCNNFIYSIPIHIARSDLNSAPKTIVISKESALRMTIYVKNTNMRSSSWTSASDDFILTISTNIASRDLNSATEIIIISKESTYRQSS